MTQLPVATAYGANQRGTMKGKLKGPIIPKTPTGCLITYSSMPAAMSSRLYPIINDGIPAATSTFSIPRLVSPRDSSMVFPCSMVCILLSSSKRSSINSFSLNRHLTLARGGVLLHSGKASLATSTAASISSLVEIGTFAITLHVAGFTTSISSPFGSTHSPSMWFLRASTSFIGSSRITITSQLLQSDFFEQFV